MTLIEPHGGELCDLLVSDDEKTALWEAARDYLKAGLPVSLLVMTVAIIMIFFIWLR